jgi:tripartite-type tricarboxylate transporter receptor subunit TctC
MTSRSRRALLATGAGALAAPLLGLPRLAFGQQLDTVHLVTGFPPAGTTDVVCRNVAERLRGVLAPTVLVENMSGANGQLALRNIKAAKPDGARMLLTPDSIVAVHPHIYSNLGVDPLTELTPVSLACEFVDGIAVGELVPRSVRNLNEFVQWCKANPNQASFGVPGSGSIPHFMGTLFSAESGTNLKHIQYRGSQPAVLDALGGHLAAVCAPVGEFLREQETGRLRILATSGRARTRFAPTVPTFAEQGFKDIVIEQWMGFYLPPKTSAAIVQQAQAALVQALATRQVADAFATFGLEPASSTPAQLAQRTRADHERWGRVVKATGFKIT